MHIPVEKCDAVNFPLPGPNCVGWEDRNIQGMNFFSHLHATKRLIGSGLPLCLRIWHSKKDCVAIICVLFSHKQRKQVDAEVLFPNI